MLALLTTFHRPRAERRPSDSHPQPPKHPGEPLASPDNSAITGEIQIPLVQQDLEVTELRNELQAG